MSATTTKAPHPVDLAVGMNIRRLRRQQGKSQELLAAACGLTFQQIQKYEKGSNRVSCSMLMQICEALACSPLDLLPKPEASGTSGFGDWAGEVSEIYHDAPALFEAVAEMDKAEIAALTKLASVMVRDRRRPSFEVDEFAYRNDPRRLDELEADDMAGAA